MCTRETPAPILTEIADRLYLRLEFMLYAVAIETDDHNEPGRVYWDGLRLLLDESVDDAQLLRQAPFPISEWQPNESKDAFDAKMAEYLQRKAERAGQPDEGKPRLVDHDLVPPA